MSAHLKVRIAVAVRATVADMTDQQPSPEDVAKWEEAVNIVREQHPDWDDATIAGAIAYAVMTPEVVAEVEEIAAQHDLDVELWTAVIADLMARFGPGTELNWTEQQCNDNLVALLRWSAEQPVDVPPELVIPETKPIISDRPLRGPR